MSTLLLESAIEIPTGVDQFDHFRAWVASEAFPERGRIDFINGRIEVDEMVEDPAFHGRPKMEVARVIANRAKQLDWGDVYVDATRVVCPLAGLSVEPDVVVVSHDAMDSGRVVEVPTQDRAAGFLELEGPPELVVEVVSRSSVTKDTTRLWSAYFEAGVQEYWVVDVRPGHFKFEIWERGEQQFQLAAESSDGYCQSHVLMARYRLERHDRSGGRKGYDLLGQPDS